MGREEHYVSAYNCSSVELIYMYENGVVNVCCVVTQVTMESSRQRSRSSYSALRLTERAHLNTTAV